MILRDEEATARLGAVLASLAMEGDVITLSGPLGVGKTSLARGFIAARGHRGEVPSPSFALIQPYDELDPPVWHVDLYRIDQVSEIDELGLDSAGDAVLLVEWPERADKRTWPGALQLSLSFGPDGARNLTAQVPPAWESRWPPQ